MKRPRKPIDGDVRRAVEMRKEGYSTAVIGKRIGVGWTALSKAIKKLELTEK